MNILIFVFTIFGGAFAGIIPVYDDQGTVDIIFKNLQQNYIILSKKFYKFVFFDKIYEIYFTIFFTIFTTVLQKNYNNLQQSTTIQKNSTIFFAILQNLYNFFLQFFLQFYKIVLQFYYFFYNFNIFTKFLVKCLQI